MQHLGQFSSGCCFRSGFFGSHHAGAGANPSVLWASPFCGTGESDFQENPDFHLWHERKRDIWRLSRDGDLLGGKLRFLIYFSPLLLLIHAVINELKGCRAGLCSCQPK